MAAYAIANLQSIAMGPPIVEYLKRIDATLTPYHGRFIVHADPADPREGEFIGDLIAIEFPDRASAVSWYESRAYREIISLRPRCALVPEETRAPHRDARDRESEASASPTGCVAATHGPGHAVPRASTGMTAQRSICDRSARDSAPPAVGAADERTHSYVQLDRYRTTPPIVVPAPSHSTRWRHFKWLGSSMPKSSPIAERPKIGSRPQ